MNQAIQVPKLLFPASALAQQVGLLLEGEEELHRGLKGPGQVLVREYQVLRVEARPAVYHDARLRLLQVEIPELAKTRSSL